MAGQGRAGEIFRNSGLRPCCLAAEPVWTFGKKFFVYSSRMDFLWEYIFTHPKYLKEGT